MNDSEFNPLALDNQLCFGLYVCSKEIIRLYAPILEPLGLTYTSYITLLSLWEKDNVTVKELGSRLFLDSGTLTPLLKKMEGQGLLTRTRSHQDERTVFVKLTSDGKNLRKKCLEVPQKMMCNNLMSLEEGVELLQNLHKLMSKMTCRKQ
ncbi:MAG: MarR family transcriptional regulator [Treponema sp.]|nr:MarR family transcriptional regulator [Treponema sp.]